MSASSVSGPTRDLKMSDLGLKLTGKRLLFPSPPFLYKEDPDRLDEVVPGVLWRADVHDKYVRFDQWDVVRETPEGYWIKKEWMLPDEKLHWRSKTGRFAHSTRRAALQQLMSRKKSYVRHSKRRHETAKAQCEVVTEACWEAYKRTPPKEA